MRLMLTAALLLSSASAQAHSFGKVYNLPVPFWLYAWAAMVALLLSFLVSAWISTRRAPATLNSSFSLPFAPFATALIGLMQLITVSALLLCVVAGFYGPSDPYHNVNMTLFWIGFVLAFAYLTAVIGNVYVHINPWRCLTPRHWLGHWQYPRHWGCWPAVIIYMAFIWIELLGHVTPRSLAQMLLAYTILNWLAAWAFGRDAWFSQGEFFSVFLRLLGKMAPIHWQQQRLTFRMPFMGLVQNSNKHSSETIFVLFMLSSTAYDGLHMTQGWTTLFWRDGFAALQPWLGSNIVAAYPTLKKLHIAWETSVLLLSPFIYLSLYLACLWLAKQLTQSSISLKDLALRFTYSLLPIVLVYHISHYYTLILTQGSQLWRLLSDPLGLGWNLFGIERSAPTIPDIAWVWHTQVGLIVFGHIVSVYIAHEQALRSFGSQRQALLSQIPMLILMMAFTVFGLWILAQPITPANSLS